MKWIYPPISFETIADETGFDGILTGFRKKLVTPETTDALLSLFEDREDYSQQYLDEIQRLELINKRYHEFRYPTWERKAGFDWESVQSYVGTMQTEEDDETKEILETKMEEMDIDFSLIASEGVSDWFCLICNHDFENKAPLKLCPNCDNNGGIIPARAINE